jgi:hypothetical protein
MRREYSPADIRKSLPDVLRTFMRSRIHPATVTGNELNYAGSLTLSPELLEAADIPHMNWCRSSTSAVAVHEQVDGAHNLSWGYQPWRAGVSPEWAVVRRGVCAARESGTTASPDPQVDEAATQLAGG